MDIAEDLDRLNDRTRAFRWLSTSFAIAMASAFLLALATGPGPFGQAAKFTVVQIHIDLFNYFARLGLQTRDQESGSILGVHLGPILLAYRLVQVILMVFTLKNLLRLNWKSAAVTAGLLVFITFSMTALTDRTGYRSAQPREFGFLYRPDSSVTRGVDPYSRPPMSLALDSARLYWATRATQLSQLNAALKSPDARFAAAEAAALHYTAAQIAYMHFDPRGTAAQLSAIPKTSFTSTHDADWRIRVMDEYVLLHGFQPSAAAYQPQTGVNFEALRIVSRALFCLGVLCLLAGALCHFATRIIVRRIKRIQGMAEKIRPTAFARSFGFARQTVQSANPSF